MDRSCDILNEINFDQLIHRFVYTFLNTYVCEYHFSSHEYNHLHCD